MDWGFTRIQAYDGSEYNAACFAMICHHCGQRYMEFFPNAKQENLFIGMVHAFRYMGVPQYVLTDNRLYSFYLILLALSPDAVYNIKEYIILYLQEGIWILSLKQC